jgi:hypothetical protein
VRSPSGKPLALIAASVAAVLLSGCVAETVERKKPRKGPVAEIGYIDLGGGEVRYSTDGWGIAVKMRRSSALRKMRRVCKKDLLPKITDEFTRDDADVPYSGMDIQDTVQRGHEHFIVGKYHHIVFDCAPKPGVKVENLANSGEKKP